MKNIWSVLCTRSVIDQRTNSLSLYDCVDEMTIGFTNPEDIKTEVKNIPANFDLVSLWHDDDAKKERNFKYQVEIVDPKNKKIGELVYEAKFEKTKKRLRTITQINGLSITVEGEYVFKTKYKSGEKFVLVSEIPVDVRFVLNIQSGASGVKK